MVLASRNVVPAMPNLGLLIRSLFWLCLIVQAAAHNEEQWAGVPFDRVVLTEDTASSLRDLSPPREIDVTFAAIGLLFPTVLHRIYELFHPEADVQIFNHGRPHDSTVAGMLTRQLCS